MYNITTNRLTSFLTVATLGLLATGVVRGDELGVSFGDAAKADTKSRQRIEAHRDLLVYRVDDVAVRADVFRPADEKTYPLVVMIHGGAWSSGDKWNLLNHAHEMAHAGFVAVSINYRLAPAHRWPAQIDDCRAGVRWAAENASQWRADPEKIGIWGYSAGAHLAALITTRPEKGEPTYFAAALGGAPCEFSFIPASSSILTPVMGGTRAEFPEVYRQASPLEFASKDVCPTFFFHGTTDAIVPQSSSRMMYQRLKELGVKTQYHSVEGHGHIVTFFDDKARQLAIEFLQAHLPKR
ncbi:MAG: alpha/beta hydrolase [Pirellulaceae bacterium]